MIRASRGGVEEESANRTCLVFNGRGPLRADLVANFLDITVRRTDVSSEAGRSQLARQILAHRNSRLSISQGERDRTDTGTQAIGRRIHDGMHRRAERENSFHRESPATSPKTNDLPGGRVDVVSDKADEQRDNQGVIHPRARRSVLYVALS